MKVSVERDDGFALLPRTRQDVLVRCFRHPDRARMHRVEAEPRQCVNGGARHSLIEQEFHALLGKSITLSSSAVAA